MKIYLAGNGQTIYSCWLKDKFYDFFRLESYHYIGDNEIPHINKYKNFMLDSGVFSYLTSKKKEAENMDWDKYVYGYAKFVKKYSIENYVEVDIDKTIGLKEVERLTRNLESQVGWKSIPVWHMNRGYDKWLEMCTDYNYVAFGAFITDGLNRKNYKMIPKFINDASKRNTKVHGLGFTSMILLKKLKFHSVDSTSWSAGHRYGMGLWKFNGTKITIIPRPKNRKMKDLVDIASYNFYEWVKYSNFAELNL